MKSLVSRISAGATLMVAAALAVPSPGQADALDASQAWNARFSNFRGDTSCAYGAADCNRCVPNVVAQFNDIARSSNHLRTVRKWTYKRATKYSPYNTREVDSMLKVDPSKGHFQSFFRVPTDASAYVPNYFATHNQADAAGPIFAIDAHTDPSVRPLSYAYRSAAMHPGGGQALGTRVLVGTESKSGEIGGAGGLVEILDPAAKLGAYQQFAVLPPTTSTVAVSNISAAKLKGGGYLLLSSVGSQPNEYRLYYTSSLDVPQVENVTFEHVHSGRSAGYENLSMITECGTGKIFVVGATAPDIRTGNLYASGSSDWALFELVPGGVPTLRTMSTNSNKMFAQSCDPRAAGTAYAGPNGELYLYCQQKQQDANIRVSGIRCGLGGVVAFFGGGLLLPGTLQACLDVAIPDGDVAYTEYVSKRFMQINKSGMGTLTVTVSAGTGGLVGVTDAITGKVCQADAGTVTCVWDLSQSSTVLLVPMEDANLPSTRWTAGCTGRNVRTGGFADSCQLTMPTAMQVTLSR